MAARYPSMVKAMLVAHVAFEFAPLQLAPAAAAAPPSRAREGCVSRLSMAARYPSMVKAMLVAHVAFEFAPLQLAPAAVAALLYRARARTAPPPAWRPGGLFGGRGAGRGRRRG